MVTEGENVTPVLTIYIWGSLNICDGHRASKDIYIGTNKMKWLQQIISWKESLWEY